MSTIDDIRPGVAVILLENGHVLLQKRADVRCWGIPSGHVEPGETVEQAAIREVREETGLHVRIQRLIGVYSDPQSQLFQYPNGKNIHFITTCFAAKTLSGKLTFDRRESEDVRFFPVNALPPDLLGMHPQWLNDALSEERHAFIR